MIQELRELASQMENHQCFLHSWSKREQQIYERIKTEFIQKLEAISSQIMISSQLKNPSHNLFLHLELSGIFQSLRFDMKSNKEVFD